MLVVAGDITDETVRKRLVDETVAKFGRIDFLINNAGAASYDNAPVLGLDADLDTFDYTIGLNTKS